MSMSTGAAASAALKAAARINGGSYFNISLAYVTQKAAYGSPPIEV